MAYGNVYVFNLYSVGVTAFNLNNIGSAGTIAAPTKGSASPYYSPPQLVVARTNLTPDQLDSPLFCVGPNSVSINYGGELWRGTVTIPAPPSPPLQSDLWLYLAFGQMFLFDTSGAMLPQPSGGGATLTKASGSSGGGGQAKGTAKLTKQGGGGGAGAIKKSTGGGSKGGGSKGGGGGTKKSSKRR